MSKLIMDRSSRSWRFPAKGCAVGWAVLAPFIVVIGCSDGSSDPPPPGPVMTGGVPGVQTGGVVGTGGVLGTGGGSFPSGGTMAPGTGGAGPAPSGGIPGMASGGLPDAAGGMVMATGGGADPGGEMTTSGGMDMPDPGGYNPCPTDGEPCRILAMGDSITVGLQSSNGGGYRDDLFGLALADGKSITFVGSLGGGGGIFGGGGPSMVDGVPFPSNHQAVSGITIGGLDNDHVPQPALSHMPDIILLMIGTNDMYRGPAAAPQRLADLLDQIIEADPHPLTVVAQITPFSASNNAVETFNEALPGIVEERVAAGAHMMLVDMYTDFPSGALADGVHPNDRGYAFMAEVWYEAIADLLP